MVIVKLFGGLGNQMFQYAAGRRLAHALGTKLKLDITECKRNPQRKYNLWAFDIHASIAHSWEILIIEYLSMASSALSKQRKWKRTGLIYKEKFFHFDRNILSLPDRAYLDGYWQSEKYFLDIPELIRREFTVKTTLSKANKEMLECIENNESVSLHIRRGDYAENPYTENYHGICTMQYYHECINEISKAIKNPCFFIFSDDPQWAKKNLNTGYTQTIVDHNGPESPFEDLRLMYTCKHHIIANSSFSWWGSWLGRNQHKLIYAPHKWFSGALHNTSDLIPEKWVRI